jgi:Putative Flp pilus-assembly TadE/G-like
MPHRERHRGQVLVLFAGAIVLLLLVGALVFDLGMSWMTRRQEQNAVDPAALAAASYVASLTGPGATAQMYAVACQYARRNGFFESATTNDTTSTGCIAANDSGHATLTVNYPPVGASAGAFEGRLGFVQVAITRVHDSIFLGILGQATSIVSASAVAANTTGNSNSYSLIALDPGCTSGAAGQLGGNGGGGSGTVVITPSTDPTTGLPYQGGYVQVNSTCGGVPTPPQTTTCLRSGTGALQVAGGSSIQAPAIFVTGECANGGTIKTYAGVGIVTQGALQVGDPLGELVPPDLSTFAAGQCGVGGPISAPTGNASKGCGSGVMSWAGTSCTVNGVASTCVSLQPGIYYGGWQVSRNITLDLAAGIYVMAGGGISVTSTGSITSVSGSGGGGSAAPVMIYSTDNPAANCLSVSCVQYQAQGAVNLSARSTLDLAGLASGPYKGMLLWQDGHGSCVNPTSCSISMGGQTNLDIAGTIYAPKVDVTLSGGGTAGNPGTASIQVISWQWQFTGGSNLLMPYDPNQLYHLEQRGLVH